ncbi:MAG: hypothetical protein WCA07_15230 [Gloeobacterales cyanobacterium]
MPTEFCVFLRFPSKEPSFFDIPEIEDYEKAVESAALEFEPREKDEGWLSVWKAKTDGEEQSLNAGFAARRNKCQTLICLRLPIDLLKLAAIQIKQDPVDNTFSCIAYLHYLIGMASEADRKNLAKLIISRLQDGSLSLDALGYRTTKSNITPLLKKVYKRCSEEGVKVELEWAEAWARTAAEEID